ncbi:TPA: hypothetical protein ACSPZX_000149 [Aeromonas veronii]
MSLLAALAKGIGAGTVNNAQVGFAEQQRLRESTQRKEEMTEEYNRRDAQLKTQIEANQADTKARLDAQKDENKNNREHDWAMWERQYAAETAAAVSSADARAREAHAKNIIGTLNEVAKNKSNILSDDKLTDEQRAIAARNNDMLFYSLVSDPAAQQLLGEFGYGGYVQQGMLLAPRQAGGQGSSAPQQSAPAPAPQPAMQPPKPQGIIPRLQSRSGSSMATGFDPKFRQPTNISAGKPVKLQSEFSLPNNDSYIPTWARRNE